MSSTSKRAIAARSQASKPLDEIGMMMLQERFEIITGLELNFRELADQLTGFRGRGHSRDVRYFPKGGLSIVCCGPKMGSWMDHGSGEHGQVIGFVMHFLNVDFKGAMDFARSWLRMPEPEWQRLLRQRREERANAKIASQAEIRALIETGQRRSYERLLHELGPDHERVRFFNWVKFDAENNRIFEVGEEPGAASPPIGASDEDPDDDPPEGGPSGGGGGGSSDDGDQADDDSDAPNWPDDEDDEGGNVEPTEEAILADALSDGGEALMRGLCFSEELLRDATKTWLEKIMLAVAARKAETDARDAADDEAKREKARRIWSSSRHLKVSDRASGYLTATRGIPCPEVGWPESVGVTPGGNVLRFRFTNAAGETVAVQRIRIGADLQLVRQPINGNLVKKPATGKLGEGVCVLQGWREGPTLLAEGPETGLSLWAATGYTVWVFGGTVNHRKMGKVLSGLPEGAKVLLCRDDDAHSSPAMNDSRKTERLLRRRGVWVRVCTPYLVQLGNRRDFNDLMLERGEDAVRKRIEAAMRISDGMQLCSLQDAQAEVRRGVDAFYDAFVQCEEYREAREIADRALDGALKVHEADRTKPFGLSWLKFVPDVSVDDVGSWGLQISVGVGKTHEAILLIVRLVRYLRAKGDARAIMISVPEHKLADNVERRIQDAVARECSQGEEITVGRWRGRGVVISKADEPLRYCCDQYLELKPLFELKAAVECTCDGCEYQRQRTQGPKDVWIVAHALPLSGHMPEPMKETGIAAAIYDESVFPSAIKAKAHLTAHDFQTAPLPVYQGLSAEEENECYRKSKRPPMRAAVKISLIKRARSAVADIINSAGIGTMLTREMLQDAGITYGIAKLLKAAEWDRLVRPEKGQKLDLAALEPNASVEPMVDVWSAIMALLHPSRPKDDARASGRLEVVEIEAGRGSKTRTLEVRARREIGKRFARVPSLLLNGTLIDELEGLVFPGLGVKASVWADAPHLRLYQVADSTFYNAKLTEPDVQDAIRAVLKAMVVRTARKGLTVSNKALRSAIEDPVSGYAGSLNYGAVAGRDDFHNVVSVIVGRNAIPARDAEDAVMALTGWAVERSEYRLEDQWIAHRNADGMVTWSITQTARHPVSLVEAFRWHSCEGQIVQAMARSRAIQNATADNPHFVLLLTSVPVVHPVNATLSYWNVTRPPIWARQLERRGYVLESLRHADAVFTGPDEISYRNGDAAIDQVQWPLDAQQTVDEASADVTVEELPSAFERLAKVTYVAGRNQKMYTAYAELGALDALSQAIQSKLGGEVKVVDVSGLTRYLREMQAAHGGAVSKANASEECNQNGNSENGQNGEQRSHSGLEYYPEMGALCPFSTVNGLTSEAARLASELPVQAFAVRALLRRGVVPALGEAGCYPACSAILKAWATSDAERARLTPEAIRKQFERLPDQMKSTIGELGGVGEYRVGVKSGRRTLWPRFAMPAEVAEALREAGFDVLHEHAPVEADPASVTASPVLSDALGVDVTATAACVAPGIRLALFPNTASAEWAGRIETARFLATLDEAEFALTQPGDADLEAFDLIVSMARTIRADAAANNYRLGWAASG